MSEGGEFPKRGQLAFQLGDEVKPAEPDTPYIFKETAPITVVELKLGEELPQKWDYIPFGTPIAIAVPHIKRSGDWYMFGRLTDHFAVTTPGLIRLKEADAQLPNIPRQTFREFQLIGEQNLELGLVFERPIQFDLASRVKRNELPKTLKVDKDKIREFSAGRRIFVRPKFLQTQHLVEARRPA